MFKYDRTVHVDNEVIDHYTDGLYWIRVVYDDINICCVGLFAGEWADSEVKDGRYGPFVLDGKEEAIYQWRCWKYAYRLFKSLGLKG